MDRIPFFSIQFQIDGSGNDFFLKKCNGKLEKARARGRFNVNWIFVGEDKTVWKILSWLQISKDSGVVCEKI